MTTWTRALGRAATTTVLALAVGGVGGEPVGRPPLIGQQLPRASGAQPRNVIFVLVDDLRFDALGFMGHTWLETPNLDALAGSGVQLRNAFVTTALCSPSRASILTGQYAHRHRVVDNNNPVPPGTTFFPQSLQKAGYETAFIGKWHMGGEITPSSTSPSRTPWRTRNGPTSGCRRKRSSSSPRAGASIGTCIHGATN